MGYQAVNIWSTAPEYRNPTAEISSSWFYRHPASEAMSTLMWIHFETHLFLSIWIYTKAALLSTNSWSLFWKKERFENAGLILLSGQGIFFKAVIYYNLFSCMLLSCICFCESWWHSIFHTGSVKSKQDFKTGKWLKWLKHVQQKTFKHPVICTNSIRTADSYKIISKCLCGVKHLTHRFFKCIKVCEDSLEWCGLWNHPCPGSHFWGHACCDGYI